MMADVGIPLYALRRQVASAIDLLVQTDRLASGRRVISHVAELEIDERTQNYVLHDVFRLAGTGDEMHLEWTGRKPRVVGQFDHAGLAGEMDLTLPMRDGQPAPAGAALPTGPLTGHNGSMGGAA
jgi:hypothetical protein